MAYRKGSGTRPYRKTISLSDTDLAVIQAYQQHVHAVTGCQITEGAALYALLTLGVASWTQRAHDDPGQALTFQD